MTTPASALPCPCGHARPEFKTYAQCCGTLHADFTKTGRLTAPDAERLMRSRYSAFVLDLRPYLLASWHPSTRPAVLDAPEPGLQWLGLSVKQFMPIDATHATVAFVARSKLAGRAYRLQETSRFVCEDGQWFYVDGDLKA